MKTLKNVHTETMRVSIAGKIGKQEVLPNETFECHDHIAENLFQSYGNYFIEVDTRNWFEKNVGLWMFLTFISTLLTIIINILLR